MKTAVKMLGTLKIVNLRTPHIGAAAVYALPIGLVVVGAAPMCGVRRLTIFKVPNIFTAMNTTKAMKTAV
ncbi:hypothetical protein MAHJHV35_46600 [Mycobacterium avium subsp. hominissuis]